MNSLIREQNEEVLYTAQDTVAVSRNTAAFLMGCALKNKRRRVRLCTHRSTEEPVHEMLIVHSQGTYIPPHKHMGRSVSFHVIEGRVDIILFDDDGNVTNMIRMGDFASELNFYYRLNCSFFYTLLIRSGTLLFFETVGGPFNRDDTIYASWAPMEGETSKIAEFIDNINVALNSTERDT